MRAAAICPMDGLLRIISGPWTTYILWRIGNAENVRFGELKRMVPGISSRVLTERLRNLENAGLLHRDYQPTIPPKVSYSLTARGEELRIILNDLSDVAQKWGLAKPCAPTPQQKAG